MKHLEPISLPATSENRLVLVNRFHLPARVLDVAHEHPEQVKVHLVRSHGVVKMDQVCVDE